MEGNRIGAHRSSVKSLGYRLRSFTGPSKHTQTRRPAVTLQIHLITTRQDRLHPTNRPLMTAPDLAWPLSTP
jgi:hypothetical protein